ncbi:AI-2E family transporter [Thioclava sp. FR2]|uniref:AI-2E family transporter n=1 Tax=Thioclava sp. FR2 TaxID=3445780 RepID=UPI003EBABBB9
MERGSQLALIVLATLATFAALDALSELAAPMALALVMGVVLSPLSGLWSRLGLSSAVGASLSLVMALSFLGLIGLLLQPLAAQMVEQAPKVWADAQDLVRAVRGLASGLMEATREVSSAAVPPANAAPAAEAEVVEMPTVTDALMIAPAVAGQILTFVGTLFFFMLTRNDIYDWIARRLAPPSQRGQVATRLRDAEMIVSKYFGTVTLINGSLGLATAAALQVIGLPGAFLWGIVAFLLNYIVYLGPATLILALLFAGIAHFDGAAVLLPALAFASFNFIEGQFVTPSLVGKQMELNPLLVFVALLFGIWLWGAIGGIVAIPLLLWAEVLRRGVDLPAAQA